MSLTAILFLIIFVVFSFLAFLRGPIWGLLLYIHVYFNMPSNQFWHAEVPNLRWSLLSLMIIIISSFMHGVKFSKIPLFDSLISKEFLAFCIVVIITGFFSAFPEIASEKLHFYFGYLLIFFLIIKIVSSLDQILIITGWIIIETLELVRLAHGHYHGGRLEGVGLPDASSANLFGGFLTMVLPFFLPFILSKDKKIKTLAIISAPLVINAFIMCGSRGAFLGLFTAVIIILSYVFKEHKIQLNKKSLLFFVIVGLIGFSILLSPDYKERLLSLTQETQEDVSSGRTGIWSHGIQMLFDYPFGVGPGGFFELSPLYLPPELLEHTEGKRAAHNTYLLVLVEQGYIGFILYFCLILTVFREFQIGWNVLKNCRIQPPLFQKFGINIAYLHLSLMASFSSFVITIFFASRLYYEFFYIFLAIITAYFQLLKKSQHENTCFFNPVPQ